MRCVVRDNVAVKKMVSSPSVKLLSMSCRVFHLSASAGCIKQRWSRRNRMRKHDETKGNALIVIVLVVGGAWSPFLVVVF